MNKPLIESLKKNGLVVNVYDCIIQFYYKYCISSETLIKKRFRYRLGREVNLDNPVKYNDKLQWLKLYWNDSLAIKCADKYEVREYVKEKVGDEYLNELYGVYDSVNEIDLQKLPNSFVIKGTHGSGFNIICKNKNQMNWKQEFKKMKRWLKRNYYWSNREIVYKNIKPRIICESFLEQNDSDELRDYRFFCFNGEPKFITVDFSITEKKRTRRNLYDLDWNLMDQEISYPKELSLEVKKPEKLKEMIELSRQLSSDFPHARIDFYYINNRILFGEITFFHQSGIGEIRPPKFEVEMGKWIKLPTK